MRIIIICLLFSCASPRQVEYFSHDKLAEIKREKIVVDYGYWKEDKNVKQEGETKTCWPCVSVFAFSMLMIFL